LTKYEILWYFYKVLMFLYWSK